MEKFLRLFERLGISEHGATLYLDLLEHGTSSVSDIAKRTGLHRVEIYRVLPLMKWEQLITEIPRGKRVLYRALSPERIEALIRDFERRNSPLLDELKDKYEKQGKNISVHYEEGAKWITKVFEDIVDSLPNGSVFYRLSAEDDVTKSNSYLPKDYREKRDKKKLERVVISSSKAAAPKSKRLERDILVIPKKYDAFNQDVTMTIYGEKVAFIDFANENSIIIDNPMIADFLEKQFKLIQWLLILSRTDQYT